MDVGGGLVTLAMSIKGGRQVQEKADSELGCSRSGPEIPQIESPVCRECLISREIAFCFSGGDVVDFRGVQGSRSQAVQMMSSDVPFGAFRGRVHRTAPLLHQLHT